MPYMRYDTLASYDRFSGMSACGWNNKPAITEPCEFRFLIGCWRGQWINPVSCL